MSNDPEELTRRTFMASATLTLGGIIGLGLAIPIAGALVPSVGAGTGRWAPLDDADWRSLQAASEKPLQISFQLIGKDAYLPVGESAEYVWGIKTDMAKFRKLRPDVYADGKNDLPYAAVTMGFALFSPICPHLGCSVQWHDDLNKFACPCHGSQYDREGAHVAGPAARGLDPLPLRERGGVAEVMWIRYAPTIADRLVVSYIS
jgi:menaquinol-cytochrome c reductase iron-sulfur subunit